MARAMVVVHPGIPERPPRDGVEMRPGHALGEVQRGQGDMAAQHPRIALPQLRRGLARPGPEGARHIRGAVRELRPAVDQVALVPPDRPVRLRRHPVMHDRPVRPGTGDGGKGFRPEQRQCPTEFQQLPGRRDLGLPAPRRLPGEPVEETRQRQGVPRMRRPDAGLLHRVLARPRQAHRILPRHHDRPGLAQAHGEPGRGQVGIDPHPPARQGPQRLRPFLRRPQRHGIAEMPAQHLVHLRRGDEQVHRPVRPQQALGQRQRRVLQIAAPNVQQPGGAVRIGQDRRILARRAECRRRRIALLFRALPGILRRLRQCPRHRRRRAVVPGGIQRVAVQRHQFGSGGRQLLHRRFRHQPRVVADAPALRMVPQPVRRRFLGDVAPLPKCGVGLRRHLGGVAPVGEDRCPLRQDDGQPGATREAGEPSQALRRARHVFAQILVRARHHEAFHAEDSQVPAQGFQPGHRGRSGAGAWAHETATFVNDMFHSYFMT